MEQKKSQRFVDLSDFDHEISLWQMIPSGSGRGLKHLQLIVNSILNNASNLQRDSPRPFTTLIVAKQCVRSHARAFLQALAIEDIKIISAFRLKNIENMLHYFCPISGDMGYIVTDIEYMPILFHLAIDSIIESGKFTIYGTQYQNNCYPIAGHLVLTATNFVNIPPLLAKLVDHIVKIEDYTLDQIKKIIVQRLRYANVKFHNQYVIDRLAGKGNTPLFAIIRVLRTAISIMLAEDKDTLTNKHLSEAHFLLSDHKK